MIAQVKSPQLNLTYQFYNVADYSCDLVANLYRYRIKLYIIRRSYHYSLLSQYSRTSNGDIVIYNFSTPDIKRECNTVVDQTCSVSIVSNVAHRTFLCHSEIYERKSKIPNLIRNDFHSYVYLTYEIHKRTKSKNIQRLVRRSFQDF